MLSRLFAGAGALAIVLAAGHALVAAQNQRFKPARNPQKAGAGKLVTSLQPAPLGATVESVLAAARQLNPALRAAALDILQPPQLRPPGPMRLMIRQSRTAISITAIRASSAGMRSW